jgi:hypothetical protein
MTIVPKIIERLNAVADPIRIGDPLITAKTPPTSPLRNLPHRLDASACLAILEKYHPDWTAASLTAAGKQLDVSEIDNFLEFTALNLEDKMVFKAALSEHGIIARGRPMSQRIS